LETRRWIVTGRVQGVGFRWSARSRAQHLGLAGWVRNLPDGRVEVQATGAETALLQFESWLRTGPPLARVASVDQLDDLIETESPSTFEII